MTTGVGFLESRFGENYKLSDMIKGETFAHKIKDKIIFIHGNKSCVSITSLNLSVSYGRNVNISQVEQYLIYPTTTPSIY